MKIQSTPRRVSLGKDRSFALTAARGALILCEGGSLWVTQDHDLRDIVLAPGETFTFDRDGPALVSALVGSSVELRAPQPRGVAGRVH